MVVPVYEEEATGVYYNTAAVIDADGRYLGKYRKNHIPHCLPAFWEKFYFKPGNLGYPVFKTRYATIGVYICYDRHFPEGGRMLGLHGAEIVFVPSATTTGHSDNLWKIEQTSMAIANGYFVGTNNRVGREAPVELRRVLRQLVLLQSLRRDPGPGQPRQGRAGGGRPRSRPHHEGPRALAVLSRPAPRLVRRHRARRRPLDDPRPCPEGRHGRGRVRPAAVRRRRRHPGRARRRGGTGPPRPGGDRLPRPRRVPRLHRHPQPLRREGPRRPRAAR